MSKETVKLTLEVPKGVVDFLKDLFALGGSENSVSKFDEPYSTWHTVNTDLGESSPSTGPTSALTFALIQSTMYFSIFGLKVRI
jgi:hypothetical protein